MMRYREGERGKNGGVIGGRVVESEERRGCGYPLEISCHGY